MGPLPEELASPPGSGTSWLEGVVVDPDGKPVPGATVELRAAPRVDGPQEPVLHVSGKTGPDGTFRLGPGPSPWSEAGVLSAFAPGFARTSLRPSAAVLPGEAFADEGTPVHVVLRPAVRVSGDVRAQDGGPPDGPVTIWAIGEKDFSEPMTTDERGAFSFLAPAGQQVVIRVLEGIHPAARTMVSAEPGTEVRASLVVRRGRDIRGQVVDHASGKPVPGAVVRAYYGKSRMVVADAEGRFLLPRYWFSAFQVQAPGYAVRRHILPSDAGTARAGPETIRLLPGFSARGRVTDLDGRPLGRVRLRLFTRDPAGDWEDFAGPVSRPDGTFTMIGLPLPEPGREIRIFAIAPGFAFSATGPLAGSPGGVAEGLHLRVPRLVLVEGRVEDEEGKPVEAWVSVRWEVLRGLEDYQGKVPSRSRPRTGPDGRWSAWVPERARVEAEATGDAFREGRGETVSPAHPDSVPDPSRTPAAPLVLKVFRGLSIRGTVEDTQGNPVGRGVAHLDPLPAGSPGPSREVPVRPDGTFEAGGLDPGTYGLSVVVVPVFLQEIRHGLSPGGPPVKVVLRRAGGMKGRLAVPPGAPPDLLAKITVRALGEASPLPEVQTFMAKVSVGDFEIGPLPPCPHALSVTAGDWIVDRERVEVAERVPTELGELVLGTGAAVAGRILYAGKPLAGADVEVLRKAGGRLEVVKRVVSGNDGTFRAAGLRPGLHAIAVRPRDRPRVEVPFEAGTGGEVAVEAEVPAGGRVLITVLDAEGRPAAGARVLLTGEAGSLLFWKEGSADPPPHATGKDGTLRCTGVVPGKIRVYAEVPGLGAGEAAATVEESRAVPVEVRLEKR